MDSIETIDWFFSAPYNYLTDERLDVYDKIVYTVLCAHASAAEKTAFPSAKTISKEGSLGRTKVFECLKKLEQLGYITREARFKVTVDKDTNKKKISNDTNKYQLSLPSTRGELVRGADHLPSSSGELVHRANYPPSTPGEHRTDLDFDFDMIDDDKKLITKICYDIFENLKPKYEKLTIKMVVDAMNRSLPKSPNNLVKYVMKVVVTDLDSENVNVKNLKINPKKKTTTRKPIRTEQLPDWHGECQKQRHHIEKVDDNLTVEEKQKEIADILAEFKTGKI